jgi:hypothetical protein
MGLGYPAFQEDPLHPQHLVNQCLAGQFVLVVPGYLVYQEDPLHPQHLVDLEYLVDPRALDNLVYQEDPSRQHHLDYLVALWVPGCLDVLVGLVILDILLPLDVLGHLEHPVAPAVLVRQATP